MRPKPPDRCRGSGLIAGLLLSAGLLAGFQVWGAELTSGIDPDAHLPFWHWSGEGVSLRLVQRLPDQTRGFFLARGFDSAAADAIAMGCVFQTIFRNTAAAPGDGAVEVDLEEWRIQLHGATKPLQLKSVWDREWERRRVPAPARIAFRWALFPTRQRFEPGDYAWGMIAFGPSPGDHFDLEFNWLRDGTPHRVSIPGLQCAPDIHPESAQ